MKLTDYILAQGGTATLQCQVLAAVAARAECAPGTLYMIAKEHKLAGPKLAGRIETATYNQVTRHDLRPDLFGAGEAGIDARHQAAANEGDAASADGTSVQPLKAA